MNYHEMEKQYNDEAQRLLSRMNCLRKAKPRAYWEKIEMNRALEIMDSMYLDCLIIGKYLKRRGAEQDAKMGS